jgi:hypothetical protein
MPNPLQNMLNFLFGFRSKMSPTLPPTKKRKTKTEPKPRKSGNESRFWKHSFSFRI